MIPPRGCAYIVMVHRQDAYRALQKLSRGNYKVNQKSIKVHFYALQFIFFKLEFWTLRHFICIFLKRGYLLKVNVKF